MVWEYNTEKTAQENLKDFEDAMAVVGYTLGDLMGTPTEDSLKFMELRAMAGQEINKIKAFNEAKDIAFAELAAQHDEERQALGALWQSYEDNDYTIE